MTAVSATSARANLYRLIDQVNDESEPLTITGQRGNVVTRCWSVRLIGRRSRRLCIWSRCREWSSRSVRLAMRASRPVRSTLTGE